MTKDTSPYFIDACTCIKCRNECLPSVSFKFQCNHRWRPCCLSIVQWERGYRSSIECPGSRCLLQHNEYECILVTKKNRRLFRGRLSNDTPQSLLNDRLDSYNSRVEKHSIQPARKFRSPHYLHVQLPGLLRNNTTLLLCTTLQENVTKTAVAELNHRGLNFWGYSDINNIVFIFSILHSLLLTHENKEGMSDD